MQRAERAKFHRSLRKDKLEFGTKPGGVRGRRCLSFRPMVLEPPARDVAGGGARKLGSGSNPVLLFGILPLPLVLGLS